MSSQKYSDGDPSEVLDGTPFIRIANRVEVSIDLHAKHVRGHLLAIKNSKACFSVCRDRF